MPTTLQIAALLAILVGVAHSALGERYILIRLFRRQDLPALFGSDWFTRRTLRFAWHITTITWWGLAAILLILGGEEGRTETLVLRIIAMIFASSALIAALASRGRHLAWVVFVAIAALTWLSS